MFHNLWSPVNAMAAEFLGLCALCDEHHTAIPVVSAGNIRHSICTPIDLWKQSLSRIFSIRPTPDKIFNCKHWRGMPVKFWLIRRRLRRLRPWLSRHGYYTLTASYRDALGPVKSGCCAWSSNVTINMFLAVWLLWLGLLPLQNYCPCGL